MAGQTPDARLQTPGDALIGACGEMVVINLPHRSDRRAEFSAQLRRVGLSFEDPRVHLFAAIRPDDAGGFPSIGARGCFMSHLSILRQARDSGAERVLICEDDFDFAPNPAARIAALYEESGQRPWDILYGFAPKSQLVRDTEQDRILHPLSPTQPVICAHFVAFRRRAIEQLVPYLEATLARPPGDPDGGPMHVDGAYNWFRRAHPDLQVLAASPAIGIQRASSTDIAALGRKDRVPVVRNLMRVARKLRNTAR